MRRDEGAAPHPRRPAGRIDELIEQQITPVPELAGEPVPVPGGGVSGEVTPLMVEPAPAADAVRPAIEYERPPSGQTGIGVVRRGGPRPLPDDPLGTVEHVGLDRVNPAAASATGHLESPPASQHVARLPAPRAAVASICVWPPRSAPAATYSLESTIRSACRSTTLTLANRKPSPDHRGLRRGYSGRRAWSRASGARASSRRGSSAPGRWSERARTQAVGLAAAAGTSSWADLLSAGRPRLRPVR